MELEYIFYVYVYGVVILTFTLMDELSVNEIIVSILFALAWPILVPAKILRRLMR